MSTNPHPLTALVGPLRFASARDFANLGSVKGLRTTLAAAVDKARGQLAAERVRALEAELPLIDASDLATRKASIARVLEVMHREGVADAPPAPRGVAPPPPPPPPPQKPAPTVAPPPTARPPPAPKPPVEKKAEPKPAKPR
ncbi:MAG: hypothetical protein ACOZQL_24680, partial [Myxococcota bacterium]